MGSTQGGREVIRTRGASEGDLKASFESWERVVAYANMFLVGIGFPRSGHTRLYFNLPEM
jgi:hypothetical protein